MSYYKPNYESRSGLPPDPKDIACLFIDVQNFVCHPKGAFFKALEPERATHYTKSISACMPKWKEIQKKCREKKVEVMYTVIESLTQDGRDRSREYKISGFHVTPGSFDSKMLRGLEPEGDEIVLPKTSCSVFQSTNIDYILRCMEKKHLIIVGILTDQCINGAVRDAVDLNYDVTLIEDCCFGSVQEKHSQVLEDLRLFCRIKKLEEVVSELDQLK